MFSTMNLYNVNAVKSEYNRYNIDTSTQDDFLYCDKCGDYVFEYCSIHGPLLVIPDDKVSGKAKYPSLVPRAALTIPSVFLHLAPSRIPRAGLGVFSTLILPRGVRFGPYRGWRSNEINSMYCWQIYDGSNKPSHVVDAADANNSNWMRYVNCARHWTEQNLVAFQYRGEIYYRTIKIIPPFTELLVFYGAEYANSLKIDLRRYNSNHEPGTSIKSNIETESTAVKDSSIENDNSTQDIFNSYSFEESNTKYDATFNNNKYAENSDSPKYKVETNNNIGYFSIINKPGNENKDYNENKNIFGAAKDMEIEIFEHINPNQNIAENTNKIDSVITAKTWQCPYCNRHFSRNTRKKSHYSRHFVKYSCRLCPYITQNALEFQKHNLRHTQKDSFACDICHFITNSSANLRKHKRTLHKVCNL